jgi:hypothetical protein
MWILYPKNIDIRLYTTHETTNKNLGMIYVCSMLVKIVSIPNYGSLRRPTARTAV